MSERKHTPGPWERLTFSNHELQTDFAMVKIGGRVHMVGHSAEDLANAQLIAAGPEMLDALFLALRELLRIDASEDSRANALEKTLFAIKKAVGE